eukprot:g28805.t1
MVERVLCHRPRQNKNSRVRRLQDTYGLCLLERPDHILPNDKSSQPRPPPAGDFEYLVKWRELSYTESTWHTEEQLVAQSPLSPAQQKHSTWELELYLRLQDPAPTSPSPFACFIPKLTPAEQERNQKIKRQQKHVLRQQRKALRKAFKENGQEGPEGQDGRNGVPGPQADPESLSLLV